MTPLVLPLEGALAPFGAAPSAPATVTHQTSRHSGRLAAHYAELAESEMLMGSRLTEIVVDCHDPVAQAAFWAAALGYHVVRTEEGQAEIAPWPQEPPDLAERARHAPIVPTLVFVAVPESKTVKNRLHLDIRPVDRLPGAEVERLIGLGARRADVGDGTQPWAVLADPEGNEFCVLAGLGQLAATGLPDDHPE